MRVRVRARTRAKGDGEGERRSHLPIEEIATSEVALAFEIRILLGSTTTHSAPLTSLSG